MTKNSLLYLGASGWVRTINKVNKKAENKLGKLLTAYVMDKVLVTIICKEYLQINTVACGWWVHGVCVQEDGEGEKDVQNCSIWI